MKIARQLVITTCSIFLSSLQPIAAQGIPKGPAADKEIDRVLGKGTADAMNKVDRTCESLTTFVRLFLSYADSGKYAEAHKLIAADSKAPTSAADLAAYLQANPAFGSHHKREDFFDCTLNQTGKGGTITVRVTADTGDKYTIEFDVDDRMNRLTVRRLFAGKTFPR
jgi:hypothetical protein